MGPAHIKNHTNYFYYSEAEIKRMMLRFYLFMVSELLIFVALF